MSLFKKEKGTEVSPVSPGTSLAPRVERTGFGRDFDSIFDDFNRSFDNLMRPYLPLDFPRDMSDSRLVQYAPLDLLDEGDHYKVHVELPGLSKENVEVHITMEGLSIRAHKEEENEKKDKNYLHRERFFTAFRRDLTFPDEVNPQKAEGSMNNGVLELKIPKKEPRPEDKPRKIEIT
jgi:HSP20 family protein